MKTQTSSKAVSLFFVIGLAVGLLTVILTVMSTPWLWTGVGVMLLLSLIISSVIARQCRWIVWKFSWIRSLCASAVVILAYPISVLVMIGSLMLYQLWLSKNFPDLSNDSIAIASESPSMWALYLAAIVGALVVCSGLRVITKRFDYQVAGLMVTAGVVAIPVSQLLGNLIGEPNWHLILLPIGQALFCGIAGYWLVRANRVDAESSSTQITDPALSRVR